MNPTEPKLSPDSQMPALRRRIDALDARLIALLAERSRLIDQAARIKTREHLPARIDSRVEEVAANARRLATQEGLDPGLADALWRLMMEHFIAQEDRVLSAPPGAEG
ncbi:chorismate mutase [Paracoccus sp. CPCC 101403]|uniref:chorismate mutase n=2 Tax=Paracoccus broussonetiae TaxID=3075834 RepID=A0ABU3E8I1_9RHOB|nr:chorismate mutase [Paracoccus sp. CPCC 101403]MDT1060522.1 chorismate mutase [Paracoccus sp. CPCC 101403]